MRSRGQRGRSLATLHLLEACQRIIEETAPITVRGVCYRLFVAGLIDSMATKNTQKISRLLVAAREEGLVPWESIVDDSRRIERQPHWTDLEEYSEVVKQSYRRDFWEHQNTRVLVISEKSTVAGILRPTLDEYGVPFMSLHGYNSATKVHDLAEMIQQDDRFHVFLYVGDHDCSGMHMSEMDLPKRLAAYGAGDFLLERIALTEDDTRELPSFGAKTTDPRYCWYAALHGDDAWELDAMNPNELRLRVTSEIENWIDPDSWDRHKTTEAAEQETLRTVVENMRNAGA